MSKAKFKDFGTSITMDIKDIKHITKARKEFKGVESAYNYFNDKGK